ncbi:MULTISPECIES: hypothetical protein [Algoriphagus]|uniref:Uncharacterized protein n=2 Tax=Algoriphagus TaxID=246875 RepID=A0A4Y9QTQ2_9BACT|nr:MULTISPECIES: hypothetical protein [Algoriphagus]MCS5490197.1 hypothetical protein [Algoriphagus limi]TFV94526.1 hypothetical protein E4S40_10935 [Algoriphagus kandeliae]
MRTIQSLLREIMQLTTNIENNFPELYKKLNENPITIPSEKNPKIDQEVLADYLESLKTLLKEELKEHGMS